jgi:hypothetical protein
MLLIVQTRTQVSVGVKTNDVGLSGSVSLFGTDSQLGTRTVQFNADEYGATGLNGEGWYFNFGSATPSSLTFTPDKVPPGHKVIIGVSYPAGTTFTVKYGVGWMEPNGDYTEVSTRSNFYLNRSIASMKLKTTYFRTILMEVTCSSRSTPTLSILTIITRICLVEAIPFMAPMVVKLRSP